MDLLRKTRYREKIFFILDSLKYIHIFGTDEVEKRSVFYSIQTAIESLIDIIAMLVKDCGIIVKSDSENIDNLVRSKEWDPTIAERLKKANGLRNLLVHHYNGINDSKIREFIPEIHSILQLWLDKIEEVLNNLE